MALASGFLFLSHNRFSYRCHPDEPGKVEQIQTGERNFHHPLLMLDATQAAFALSGMEAAPQKVVWMGRTVTAVFAILTVLAFSCAAYFTAGRLAALLCGAFLLATPLLIAVAHYFKEDPAMTMGLGLSFLAIALYQRTPSLGHLFLLAAGAALAASGKYLGAAILPFCLYTLFKQGGGLRHLAPFLGFTVGVYALLNFQAVAHFAGCLGAINQEVGLIKTGGGIASGHFSPWRGLGKYSALFVENSAFPLFWFAGFGVWNWMRRRPAKTPFGQVALFTLLLFVTLAAVPKSAARYLLPVLCGFCFVAAVGAARLWKQGGWGWKTVGFALPLACALAIAIPRAHAVYRGFKDDSRLQMARWITDHL
ncbi:MAG: hypothetical protein PHQ12_13550, partial [Chthoniobacteraceae bacterium]|nr:hypothetical protein [Chthoniobacteraceae bacterium]